MLEGRMLPDARVVPAERHPQTQTSTESPSVDSI
jgi:hypothetical protein